MCVGKDVIEDLQKHCCKFGETGKDCERNCPYYVETALCSHPRLVIDAIEDGTIEKGQLPECGHMCC